MFGANCGFMMLISGTMAPKNRNSAIQAFKMRLRGKDSNTKQSDRSNEVYQVWTDPEAGCLKLELILLRH